MSVLKQMIFVLFALLLGLAGWVYFFPGAITTLAGYNLAFSPLRQLAALNANEAPVSNGSQRRGQRQALVITAPVGEGIVNDRLNAIGNGRAAQSVSVTSLVSGQIVELAANSGEQVEAGTVIARLDSENESLALEKAKLAAADLRAKAERQRALFQKRSTTATAVENAEVELNAAELAVREAQLNLDRRTIKSPISGIVGIVTANIGDYVTNQSPIVTIDDRSRIYIDFYVPERFAVAIRVGAPVAAYSVARPGEQFDGEVVAVDNRVDVNSRTLQVRAEIENNQDQLRAGMAFKVSMQFDGEKFAAVDPLAIQWDSNGSYVWLIDKDTKAQRVNARIVQRNPETVLVEADLSVGDRVVTEGVHNVRTGVQVKISGEENSGSGENEGKAAGS